MTKYDAIAHYSAVRVNKASLARTILEIIAKSADGYVRLEDFANNPYLYAYYGGRIVPPKSNLAAEIRRLLKKSLIEEASNDAEIIIKLTDHGKEVINVGDESYFDRWTMVIFDIPEQKKIVRDLFRRNLKRWGFKQLQRSIWVSRKAVFNKVDGYITETGLASWVYVLETNKDNFTNKIVIDR